MKTSVITSLTYQNHDTGPGHPERVDRVKVVNEELKKLEKQIRWFEPKLFDHTIIEKVHKKNYLEKISISFPKNGIQFLDGDTIVSPGSKEAALDAVGSIILGIDQVVNKEFKNTFCSVRPPGHHAESDKAMGFCIYNNVAVGAAYLLHYYQYKKVAIIDYDVHHGNGTQEIFYNNSNVLYISTHQYPFYPGTGSVNEKGASNNILNIPLDPGTSSDIYFNSFENVLKKLKSFNPEFILLSSGFDAHQKDPLAQVNLKSKDFYEITKRIMNVADNICDGRIVSILEGGYDLDALKESAYEHVKALIEN
ncbi:deacetylase, histone deacetylase/acetoin utilization protein [alpha proteobacterium HIMB114]|nr:deacetylase, histone deacetylase/acetoin utilization protein [alpha proteobacterium HIMB114]